MVQSPNWRHQQIALSIAILFRQHVYVKETAYVGIAPFDMVIRRKPKLRTRQADMFYKTRERLKVNAAILAHGPLEVAPELVVEILSLWETPRTLRNKLDDFLEAGIQEVWVVSPESETVQVERLSAAGIERVRTYAFGETVQSVVLRDLAVATASMFAV